MGKRQSQLVVLGKLDIYVLNSESGPLSYSIYKNKFKTD